MLTSPPSKHIIQVLDSPLVSPIKLLKIAKRSESADNEVQSQFMVVSLLLYYISTMYSYVFSSDTSVEEEPSEELYKHSSITTTTTEDVEGEEACSLFETPKKQNRSQDHTLEEEDHQSHQQSTEELITLVQQLQDRVEASEKVYAQLLERNEQLESKLIETETKYKKRLKNLERKITSIESELQNNKQMICELKQLVTVNDNEAKNGWTEVSQANSKLTLKVEQLTSKIASARYYSERTIQSQSILEERLEELKEKQSEYIQVKPVEIEDIHNQITNTELMLMRRIESLEAKHKAFQKQQKSMAKITLTRETRNNNNNSNKQKNNNQTLKHSATLLCSIFILAISILTYPFILA